METLKEKLLKFTQDGALYQVEKNNAVRCFACGHRCFIPDGFDGICKVRSNRGGHLKVPWGYIGALQVDPIEKKPFFHVLPGNKALSFGMLGCDFHCGYCQNWFTSQALRDTKATANPQPITPDELINIARREGAKVLTSTYNEPLITSEWAVEIFSKAVKAGLLCSYVSNGNGTKEVLDYIRPYVKLYKIDLKAFNDKRYRELGGVLKNILTTIEQVHEMGIWLEIVSLIIPGFNDDPKELREMAKFLSGISRNIPWHCTAFHKDYKMTSPEDTTAEHLRRAYDIGKEEGLNFVYLGNLPGQVGGAENTLCPECDTLLIRRLGYRILSNHLEDGSCPKCKVVLPGVWE